MIMLKEFFLIYIINLIYFIQLLNLLIYFFIIKFYP